MLKNILIKFWSPVYVIRQCYTKAEVIVQIPPYNFIDDLKFRV